MGFFGKRSQSGAATSASPGTLNVGPPSCSFCLRTQHDVRWLVAGPACFICEECILLSLEIVVGQNLQECCFCRVASPNLPLYRHKAGAICAACAQQAVAAMPPASKP